MQTRTLLTVLLAAWNVCALPHPQQQSSTSAVSATSSIAASSTATAASSTITDATTSVTSSTPSASASSSEVADDGSEYYPSEPGRSYDDDPNAAQSTVSTGGNDGSSTTFMSMSMPAQIGIIVAVVFCAVAMFVGSVLYYFYRRRQWEKEVQRRSQLIISKSKPVPKNISEESLGGRGSTTTTISAAGTKSEFDTETSKPDPVWKKWMPRL
ncbi:hypothetical protein EDC01DRAFT_635081 [Geopyxis carbonaria]|nr:hypothetical protein EDC01DRAFT_635081 [Geopyxis carbonaria]